MNKISSIVFSLCLILLLANPGLAETRGIGLKPVSQATTPYANGVFRALVIGNNQYHDAEERWPDLKTAVSDAREIASLLSHDYGFHDVRLLENATRREILKALEHLSRQSLQDDSVLIYYAGHGFLDQNSKRGFWVPVDAQGVDNTTFLRNSTIRDELMSIASRARHTLLLSDSCFSGSLLRQGNRGITQNHEDKIYLEKVAKRKSVQIMTAGGIEYVDDNYRGSGHSPFTYFLLNELKNNDRSLLTVSELSSNVSRAVANNADQIPESGVLYGAGDELGEFIFIKLKVSVDGVPVENVKINVEVVSDKAEIKSAPAAVQKITEIEIIKSIPVPTL